MVTHHALRFERQARDAPPGRTLRPFRLVAALRSRSRDYRERRREGVERPGPGPSAPDERQVAVLDLHRPTRPARRPPSRPRPAPLPARRTMRSVAHVARGPERHAAFPGNLKIGCAPSGFPRQVGARENGDHAGTRALLGAHGQNPRGHGPSGRNAPWSCPGRFSPRYSCPARTRRGPRGAFEPLIAQSSSPRCLTGSWLFVLRKPARNGERERATPLLSTAVRLMKSGS
jgi:hypothetical protein